MPELVRLYIKNIFVGFGLALVFVGLLLWFNVANLWHLISTSDIGYIAVALLIVFNTIVFAGVQFGIVIMRMAEPEDRSGGGRRDAIPSVDAKQMVAIPVPAEDPARRLRNRR